MREIGQQMSNWPIPTTEVIRWQLLGNCYLNFMDQVLPEQLQDVPIAAPFETECDFNMMLRQRTVSLMRVIALNAVFRTEWIGRG